MGIWEYLMNNSLALIASIVGLIGWFLERQKRKAELQTIITQNKQQEASALSTIQEVYATFSTDVKKEITSLKEEICRLKGELDKANKERDGLVKQVEEFKKQSRRDAEVIGELREKLNNYEKQLEKFKLERN